MRAQADVQYTRDVDYAQEKYNSIVFNAFIFLQLFNQINARKIKDELNVFKGGRPIYRLTVQSQSCPEAYHKTHMYMTRV